MKQSINGHFKSFYPFVSLNIDNTEINFLIDTGFNSYIMLPRIIIEHLGLVHSGYAEYGLANGQTNITKIYDANINILDKDKEIFVIETGGKFSLAGIKLFEDCKIILEKNKNIVEISKE